MVGVVLALVLGGAGYAWHRSREPAPLPPAPARASALDAIPSDASLLVTVDLAALRASPLAGALDTRSAGAWLGNVRAECGFEPIDSVSELALAAPSGGADGDFGIVGAGGVDRDKLLDCATRVITGRGGKPVTSSVGSFKTVRDVSGSGARSTGEIAVRGGGPLLIGSGDFMRAMIDAADGALPSVKTNQAHAALRAAVAEGALLELSIVLTPQQRAAVAEEVDIAGGKAPVALKGVLAAALGAKVTSETVQAHGVVLVSDEAQAKELAEAFTALKKARAESPLLRVLGLDSWVNRIRVTTDGKEVHARLEVTIEEARALADRLSTPVEPHAPAASASPVDTALPSASAVASPRASAPPAHAGSAAPRPSSSASLR